MRLAWVVASAGSHSPPAVERQRAQMGDDRGPRGSSSRMAGRAGVEAPRFRCAVPDSDGAFSRQQKGALWQQIFTAQSARRRVFEPISKTQASDRPPSERWHRRRHASRSIMK
jgi:hypothetical protein